MEKLEIFQDGMSCSFSEFCWNRFLYHWSIEDKNWIYQTNHGLGFLWTPVHTVLAETKCLTDSGIGQSFCLHLTANGEEERDPQNIFVQWKARERKRTNSVWLLWLWNTEILKTQSQRTHFSEQWKRTSLWPTFLLEYWLCISFRTHTLHTGTQWKARWTMGKVMRFDITLGNPNGIYHPGDILAGQVSLKAREDIPIHGKFIMWLSRSFLRSIPRCLTGLYWCVSGFDVSLHLNVWAGTAPSMCTDHHNGTVFYIRSNGFFLK